MPGTQQQLRRQGGEQQWPALGQQWDLPQLQQGDGEEGDESSSEEEGEEEAKGPAGLQQPQQPGQQRRRVARFRPPAFCIVTGRGRHSEAYRGGVLKAAVQELLLLQGLPARSDPSNAGTVRWGALLPQELAYQAAARPAAVEQAGLRRPATPGIELRLRLPGLAPCDLHAPVCLPPLPARLPQGLLWCPGNSWLPICSSRGRPCTLIASSLQVGAAPAAAAAALNSTAFSLIACSCWSYC